MIPEEVFKRRRRHNNTPGSVMLIITNFIVVSLSISAFTDKTHVNWFFWVVLGFLGVYNFFTIRRNREEFNKVTIITYTGSILVLIVLFFVLRPK
jgi:cell division protein FtsW (lipid II flippase)